MKVFAVGKEKKFFKIGESLSDSIWCGYDPKIEEVIHKVSKGDEVKATVGKDGTGKNVISSIEIISSKPAPTPKESAPASTSDSAPKQTTYAPKSNVVYRGNFMNQKHPVDQEAIYRGAIGHMVSRTIIGLQGSITLDNVEDTIDKLWKKYEEHVTK